MSWIFLFFFFLHKDSLQRPIKIRSLWRVINFNAKVGICNIETVSKGNKISMVKHKCKCICGWPLMIKKKEKAWKWKWTWIFRKQLRTEKPRMATVKFLKAIRSTNFFWKHWKAMKDNCCSCCNVNYSLSKRFPGVFQSTKVKK